MALWSLQLCCHKPRNYQKPAQEPGTSRGSRALPTPWSRTSSLQNCEIINFCYLNHLVCHCGSARKLIQELWCWCSKWIIKKAFLGTSLVAQWLRIRLPMQGTRVRALVREDPTCRGATKPVRHNYWACALEPWATTTEPVRLEPVLCNKRSHRNEKPVHRNKVAPARHN